MSLRSAKLLEHAALDVKVLGVVQSTPGISLRSVYARLNTGATPTRADVDRSLQRLRKRKVVEYDGPRGGWVAK
jgi:hypothetical protein